MTKEEEKWPNDQKTPALGKFENNTKHIQFNQEHCICFICYSFGNSELFLGYIENNYTIYILHMCTVLYNWLQVSQLWFILYCPNNNNALEIVGPKTAPANHKKLHFILKSTYDQSSSIAFHQLTWNFIRYFCWTLVIKLLGLFICH